MDLYDRIRSLCDERGVSFRKVEREIGIGHGSINRWHNQMPKADTLQKVADYFGVTPSYLLGNVEDETQEYYIDPEVSAIAQELKDRPELKILFDASRNVKKEDIELVAQMIRRISGE